MTGNLYSTDKISPGKFKPHGRVEYEERGNILWTRAVGPFNAELVEVMGALVRDVFPGMASKGTWVNLCEFEQSALCTPEALAHLTTLGRQLVQLKLAPSGIAFVLPHEIEGATFMGPHYAKHIREAEVRFEWFATVALAEKWAESVLSQ